MAKKKVVKKKPTTRKKPVKKPVEKQVNKPVEAPIKNFIDDLDEFFTLSDDDNQDSEELQDESVLIDDLLKDMVEEEDVKEMIKSVLSPVEVRELEADNFIKNYSNDEDISAADLEQLKFFRDVYIYRDEIHDDFYHFVLKFKYFMVCENLFLAGLTHNKIGKFLRHYYSMDIVAITNFFGVAI